MASKVWQGFIQLGMLSVPVYMTTAARDKRIDMHQYHTKCNGRINKPTVCLACDPSRALPADEIYKGYEVSADKILRIEKAELEAIQPQTEKIITISHVLDAKDLDLLYYNESFYVLPDVAGRKAYSLLAQTLQKSERIAVAQICKGNREHIIVLRPLKNGLAAHFLYYQDEVPMVAEFEQLDAVELRPEEFKLGTQVLAQFEGDFDMGEYEDGYRGRLNRLIESKLDKTVSAPAPVKIAAKPTQDLMAALTASIAAKPPQRAKKSNVNAKAGKRVA